MMEPPPTLTDEFNVSQVRSFATTGGDAVDYVGLVEGTLPPSRASLDLAAFGESAKGVDLINRYSPYWRRRTRHMIQR